MVVTSWLVDKSAALRIARSPRAELWQERLERGLLRVSTVTLLEMGFSVRTATEHESWVETGPAALMPVEPITPGAEDRAVAVQRALALRGQHRSASIPDLLVAAVGELADLTVLHVDKDFDLIAEVTGQSVERLDVD